jgi:hypothetical protein
MKIAALILGLIGGLMLAGLGMVWVDDWRKHGEEAEAMVREAQAIAASVPGARAGADQATDLLARGERRGKAGYAMMALGLIAVAASAAVLKLRRKGAIIMLVAAVVPAMIEPASLLAGAVLLLAAVLAWTARWSPRPAAGPTLA